jgi:hypothetical protein
MRSASFFIAEQAIEVHKSFCGIVCCPLSKFLLHFANIHRSSPVPWLPLRQKFQKAKGLRHVDGFPVFGLLRPFRHLLRHWGFVGVSLTYCPLPLASFKRLPVFVI